ncbi:MAG: hypothetical protein MJB14_07830 [Spirochaetes bacterium]|nr:hypothetical protein [Spirochaetota bacterium]
MKMSPFFKKAMENMKPGTITKTGFLGDDKRPLIDIIEEDEELLEKLKLNIPQLTERMKYFLEEGEKGLGEPITVDNKYLVQVYEARGKLPSPFEDDGLFRKINVTVENLELKKTIIYSELSLHLIEKFHFFQGKGSTYRLDPKLLKEVLEI